LLRCKTGLGLFREQAGILRLKRLFEITNVFRVEPAPNPQPSGPLELSDGLEHFHQPASDERKVARIGKGLAQDQDCFFGTAIHVQTVANQTASNRSRIERDRTLVGSEGLGLSTCSLK